MSKRKEGEKTLVSNETFAKVTDSWKEGERIFVRHRVATGSPNEVKKIIGDLKSGAKQSMPYAHNIKVYETTAHKPGTHGVVKEKTFVIEEDDTLGDGEEPRNDPTSSSFETSSELPSETPVDDFKRWTKNIVDKLIDAKNLQWVAILATLFVGALALGLALVR